MTQEHDAETVERVARAIASKDMASMPEWDMNYPEVKDEYRAMARAALSAMPPREVTVQEAARDVITRAMLSMKSQRQGGYSSYCGDGKWGFISTSVSGLTPQDINVLFEFVGIVPNKIQQLGKCSDCAHAINGRERGYLMPCVQCLRPKHDLFEPRALAGDKP